ncbi:MAG: FYDLN acid domain-containing protein [Clostridiales bacterium]|nr:FYDLN acid domain-containing protein [Clostridiales bacterium]
MREKLARFLAGRYGTDDLNKLLSVVALVLLILALIITRVYGNIGSIIWLLGVITLFLCYYRMFSRNIAKRQAENQKFQSLRYGRAVNKQRRKERAEQSKDYKFFKCPKCGVLNRVPKGKGKIQITCPKCGEQFIRKS